MKKLIKGKIKLNNKIILLISIILVIFISGLVLFYIGNRNFLLNNSVVQDECDYRSGWEKITENGKTYCRFLVRNDYSCPSGYELDRKNRKCKKIIGYDYDCPDNDYNYIKSGSGKNLVCKRKVQYCSSGYKITGGGSTAYCKPTNMFCPNYTKLSSDGKKCEYTYKEPGCDKKGYLLIGGGSSAYCQKNVGKEYYCTGLDYKLDSKKGTCTYYTTGPGCSSGYQMVGGGSTAYCIKYSYDCPKNYKSHGSGKNKTCTYTYKEKVCKSGWYKVTSNGNDVKCQKDLGRATNGKCSKGVKEGKRCYLYEKMTVVSKVDKRKAIKTQYTAKVINKTYTNTVSAKTRTKFDYNSKVIQINKKGYTDKIYKTEKVKEKYVTDKAVSTPKYETIKATVHPVYKIKSLNSNTNSNGLLGVGQLTYSKIYTTGNAKVNGEINNSEPDPSAVVNYWADKGRLKSGDFVYPMDSVSGKSLGAWPKNYKDYPTQLENMNVYNGYFIWPVSTTNGFYQTSYEHTGFDIQAKFGTPVYSPVDGKMVYSTWGNTANLDTDESAYAVTLTPDKFITYEGVLIDEIYLTHMSGIRYRCEEGSCNRKVKKGELLGFSGTAAGSRFSNGSKDYGLYGPHLHVTYYNSSNYDGGLLTSQMEGLYGINEGTSRIAGQ